MRWPLIALLILGIGCVGPLDRRDGALVLMLSAVPAGTDTVEVSVHTEARTFTERLPAPMDGVIDELSAVPAGSIRLDVRLYAEGQLVDARIGIPVVVMEGVAVEVSLDFAEGPTFRIEEPAANEPHRLRGGGQIPVAIESTSGLPLEITATANGTAVPLTRAGALWTGMISPLLAGEILPGTIELVVTACLAVDCTEQVRSVIVTRNAWSISVLPMTAGRPAFLGEDALVYADAAGGVHVVSMSSGASMAEVAIDAPVFEDVAVLGGAAYVVDEEGGLTVINVGDTLDATTLDVGATTAPVAGSTEVFVGAGADLLAISGTDTRIAATLPRRMRAPPLVDGDGIAAADILGNVLVLDASEQVVFSTNVGAPVYAAPVRHDGAIVIATGGDGQVLRFAGDGTALPGLSLGQPIVQRPVSVGARLLVAADDRFLFLDDQLEIEATVDAGEPITGAPVLWEDGVVAGLRNGLVAQVDLTGMKPMGRVQGAATTPLVLAERRVVVVGTGGDLAMLEPEEDF